MLSSLPRLRFSSHRGEFAVNTFGKDEVLPRAHGSVVSSGTVAVILYHSSEFLFSFYKAQSQLCIWEDCVLKGIKDTLADLISAAQECAEVGIKL